MATKVYKSNNFLIVDNGTEKILYGANQTEFSFGDDKVYIVNSAKDYLYPFSNKHSEVLFTDFQDESGASYSTEATITAYLSAELQNSISLSQKTDDDIAVPAIITEDIFHYAVHEGLAFSVGVSAVSGDQYICFKTPNTSNLLHILWSYGAEENVEFNVYEGVTPATTTDDLIVYNKNRASSMNGRGDSGVIAGNSDTVGSVQINNKWTGGTVIYSEFAAKKGGVTNPTGELVLEKNTWYGFELADIGTKDLGMTLTWFEVPVAS